MTVSIETLEGIKAGSAVREVSVEFQPRPLPKEFPYHIETKVSGEAVPIDLGQKGIVFALIDWDSYRELYNAFPYSGQMDGKSKFPRDDYYKKTLKPGMKSELKKYLPQMVTFKDINDPKTVTLVYGGRFDVKTQKFDPVDDFETIFGKGVKLKAVTVEITDEPVTWEIEEKLVWLRNLGGGYLDGQFAGGGPELSNILYGGNFKTGDLR